ncbi:hypothetical protein [Methylobacterium sp. WL6]|uniref:hypothetical protein n=1 Tax=Methylobacterium sp. WL6 TaxID=2603901 RepID=UPI0011C958D3|nr:hypothetical protein [Methylobacterium sp. WL6]TXN73432.1 hypothetical protein FV230_01285 [Methylobacterium sp. WL6]
MTPTEAFLSYSEKRIADLRQGIDLMEAKTMRTYDGQSDTTAESLAGYRRDLAELLALRSQFEAGNVI